MSVKKLINWDEPIGAVGTSARRVLKEKLPDGWYSVVPSKKSKTPVYVDKYGRDRTGKHCIKNVRTRQSSVNNYDSAYLKRKISDEVQRRLKMDRNRRDEMEDKIKKLEYQCYVTKTQVDTLEEQTKLMRKSFETQRILLEKIIQFKENPEKKGIVLGRNNIRDIGEANGTN